jgi:hypothetical protein
MIKTKSGVATAQSITSQAQLYGQKGRPDLKNGYGKLITNEGNFINGIDEGGRALDLIGSLSQQDVAGAKASFMKDMKTYYREIIQPTQQESSLVLQYQQLTPAQRETAPAEMKRAVKAAGMRDATIDQLAQWVGPYSGASTDVKVAAQQWARDFGIHDEVVRRSRYVDPSNPTGARPDGGDTGALPGGGGPK